MTRPEIQKENRYMKRLIVHIMFWAMPFDLSFQATREKLHRQSRSSQKSGNQTFLLGPTLMVRDLSLVLRFVDHGLVGCSPARSHTLRSFDIAFARRLPGGRVPSFHTGPVQLVDLFEGDALGLRDKEEDVYESEAQHSEEDEKNATRQSCCHTLLPYCAHYDPMSATIRGEKYDNIKFQNQLVADPKAMHLARTRRGNVSPSTTHAMGPHEREYAPTCRIANAIKTLPPVVR